MKHKPDFGTPTDEIERDAHAWLTENLSLEGESVMHSLSDLIRKWAIRKVLRGPSIEELVAGITPENRHPET